MRAYETHKEVDVYIACIVTALYVFLEPEFFFHKGYVNIARVLNV